MPRLKLRPLSEATIQGLEPLIQKYEKNGLIEICMSRCNTPIMAVSKQKEKATDPTEYRFIHDLKAINNIVEPMKAQVANPYTILNGISHEATHFTVIDLKDAFFSIPINKDSCHLIAFEWTDPRTRQTNQYRWTVLPQGFVHAPTIFTRVLGSHLDQG